MSNRVTKLKFKGTKRPNDGSKDSKIKKQPRHIEEPELVLQNKENSGPRFSFDDYKLIEAEDPKIDVLDNWTSIPVEPVKSEDQDQLANNDRMGAPPSFTTTTVDGKEETDEPAVNVESKLRSQYDVPYEFGDSGSSWRMMKLENIYRTARESNKLPEIVALERYGNLLDFDIAREEQKELEDRKNPNHKRKDKPIGIFYHQREFDEDNEEGPVNENNTLTSATPSQLNEMRAKVLRAKLQKAPNYIELEEEYKKMEKSAKDFQIGSKFVEDDADSISTMAKKEMLLRDNKELIKQSVKAIMKDKKFSTDLDEQDDNMSSLASNIQKGKLKLTGDVSKLFSQNKILQRCSLCLDNNRPLPIIKQGEMFYLALAPHPPMVEHSTMIVPFEHYSNSLKFGASETAELEKIMICLSKFYFENLHKKVIFYESNNNYDLHCTIMVIPLPLSIDDSLIYEYFKNAILEESNDLDQQHRLWFDTREISYRNYISEEAPFFHLWLTLSGGLGHIVEEDTWPRGDLFARRVIGGILKLDKFDVERKTRYYVGGNETDKALKDFKQLFDGYSWA